MQVLHIADRRAVDFEVPRLGLSVALTDIAAAPALTRHWHFHFPLPEQNNNLNRNRCHYLGQYRPWHKDLIRNSRPILSIIDGKKEATQGANI
jgi:hypothetical protein